MALRWGIAAAGKISHDFATGLGTLADDEHKMVAIAARDKPRAECFAKIHGIPISYGSYIELAEDPNVEVVYVGVLNPQHYEISMMMLENGKHVLCEKPLCMNEKQAKKLIQYAERKNLFLMEAVWSRFFPAYQYIRKQIETGVLGDVKEVEVYFGFKLIDIDRVQKKELGGGTIMDLGIYTIQLCQWAFNEPPKSIIAKGELNAEGVDIEMEAKLHYSNGGIGKMKTSSKELLSNAAVIKGSKAQITLLNFWCPTTLIDIDGNKKTWALPEGKLRMNFHNSTGLSFEAEEVRRCIRNGEIQSDIMSHNESLLIAQIEDTLRKQLGVVYEEDSQ